MRAMMNTLVDSTEAPSDTPIRVVEGIVLALLTIPYLLLISMVALKWLQTDEMLKFDVGQWGGMGGVWGLVSLWWLVIRVTPSSAGRIKRLPIPVAIGVVLGVFCLAQLMYLDLQRRPFDPLAHGGLFLFCLLPILILLDRLRVLWRYRQVEQ